MIRKSKALILIAIVILFSSIALSLTTITNFITGPTEELIFNGNSERNVSVELWGHSYVTNVSMTVTRMLSDWVTENSFSNLNSPQDAEYISALKWLIADTSQNRVIIVNPSTGELSLNYTNVEAPNDVEYIDATTLLITNTGKDKIIILDNITTIPVATTIYTYSMPDPVFLDADLVASDKLLVTDKANKIVRLVNLTTAIDILNYTTGVYEPFDAEYINDEIWLIAENNRVIMVNSTSNTILKQYSTMPKTVYGVESIEANTKWLITVSDEVFILNVSNDVKLNEYTRDLKSAKDAKYVNQSEWLITDETGTKRVALEKKYYPTNINLDVGDDGDKEWNHAGELKTTEQIQDSVLDYNLSKEMNDYLENVCNNLLVNCTIPFIFQSDTHGKLNISNLNVLVDKRPTVTVMNPNGEEVWAGIQAIRWNAGDDDNDNLVMNVYYWNTTDWVLINVSTGLPGIYTYDWDTTIVPDMNNIYNIKVSVTDNIAPIVNDTSDATFTIDNTNPQMNFVLPTTAQGNYSQDWITANVTVVDANLVTITINIYNNSGLVASTNGAASPLYFNFANLSDGVYYLNATVNDTAGNINHTETRTIMLDANAPAISFLTPPTTTAGLHNQDHINASVNANDGMNLDTVTINLYNTTGLINSTNLFAINFVNLPEGTYYLNATANDTVGNKNFTETRIIQFDFTPPIIQLQSPANGASTTNKNINFTYQLTDTTITNCSLTLNGAITDAVNLTTGNHDFDKKLNVGTYIWNMTCTDKVGLTSISATRTLTIKNPPSAPSSGGGGGGSYYCNPSWTCTEWGPCMIGGTQTRTCIDEKGCGTNTNKPIEQQICTYEMPFKNFGVVEGGENLIEEEQEQQEEEQPAKEQEKGMEEITGAVTGGFFDSTTGKVTIGVLVLLIAGAATIIVRNAIRNKGSSNPPQTENISKNDKTSQ